MSVFLGYTKQYIRTIGFVLFFFWLFQIKFSFSRDFKFCILTSKQIYVCETLLLHSVINVINVTCDVASMTDTLA